jgi:hypothetical protein
MSANRMPSFVSILYGVLLPGAAAALYVDDTPAKSLERMQEIEGDENTRNLFMSGARVVVVQVETRVISL